jgi:hypothetical protein
MSEAELQCSIAFYAEQFKELLAQCPAISRNKEQIEQSFQLYWQAVTLNSPRGRDPDVNELLTQLQLTLFSG